MGPFLAATTLPVGAWVELASWYSQARTPLITISGTAAAICISTASFVFPKVKETVYDSDDYARLVAARRHFNPSYSANGSLRRWLQLLVSTVVVALVSVVCQITLGFIQTPWALGACLLLAALTFVMLALVGLTTWRNLRAWLRWSATKAEKRIGEAVERPLTPV